MEASGQAKKNGHFERTARMTMPEITSTLDECFAEMKYVEDEFPFPSGGWRTSGVPSEMIILFCQKLAANGTPLKCAIYHNGEKIFEFVPDTLGLKLFNCRTPIMNFTIHENHAYFYRGGHMASSKTSVRPLSATKQDEFTDRRIREPFPTERRPPFEEWRHAVFLEEGAKDGFLDLYHEFNPVSDEPKKKRSRVAGAVREERKVLYFYVAEYETNAYGRTGPGLWGGIEEYAGCLDKCAVALQGTDRCFSVERLYGSDPHIITSISIRGKGLPRNHVSDRPTQMRRDATHC